MASAPTGCPASRIRAMRGVKLGIARSVAANRLGPRWGAQLPFGNAIATVYGVWQKQQRFLNTGRQIREQQNVT